MSHPHKMIIVKCVSGKMCYLVFISSLFQSLSEVIFHNFTVILNPGKSEGKVSRDLKLAKKDV